MQQQYASADLWVLAVLLNPSQTVTPDCGRGVAGWGGGGGLDNVASCGIWLIFMDICLLCQTAKSLE